MSIRFNAAMKFETVEDVKNGPRQDHVSYSGQRSDHQQFDRFCERDKLLKECLARGGDNYDEICDLLSMSHSGQGSSSKFKKS